MWRLFILTILFYQAVSCSEEGKKTPIEIKPPTIKLAESQTLGNSFSSHEHPTIAHVRIVDLDQDGYNDVIVCDVLGQGVGWIRQLGGGSVCRKFHSLTDQRRGACRSIVQVEWRVNSTTWLK